jgi:hypothetical protein
LKEFMNAQPNGQVYRSWLRRANMSLAGKERVGGARAGASANGRTPQGGPFASRANFSKNFVGGK